MQSEKKKKNIKRSKKTFKNKFEPRGKSKTMVVDSNGETITEFLTVDESISHLSEEKVEFFSTEVSVPTEWQIGDYILETYQVTDILGIGGMGKVYKVHHLGWNVDLAVKSPHPKFFRTEEQKRNFTNEVETWINLGRHPHIVSCYYVRTIDGIPRAFAEYIEGDSLSYWIRKGKLYKGGPEKVLECILDAAIQFAWGLLYAHQQGLVHQDVKPANVMMTMDGTAMVTDFGLAKTHPVRKVEIPDKVGGTILVSQGGMTLPYCSPEQFVGQRLSHRTDIWSWGVSVLEMFMGEVTWRVGQVVPGILTNYLKTKLSNPSIPKMPVSLVELLRRCLREKPSDRPATMEEVVTELQVIYQQEIGQPYPRQEPLVVESRADRLNNKALSLLDLGQEEEAGAVWKEALNVDSHHIDSIYNRELWKWRTGRQADDMKFVERLETIAKIHKGSWQPQYLLGQLHLERGDGESAKKALEEALSLVPEDEKAKVEEAMRCMELMISDSHYRDFSGNTENIESMRSIAVTTDGRYVVSGSSGDPYASSGLYLWDLETCGCLKIFGGFGGTHNDVTVVIVLPDGRSVLSGGYDDKVVRMWDLEHGFCFATIEGHKGIVFALAVTPDGKYLLSGGKDRTVRLWHLKSRKCLSIFKGHRDSVNAVAVTSNGCCAISGSDDKTLRLWDLVHGKCLRVFKGHKDGVVDVAVIPGDHYAVSGSRDNTLRLWDLKSGRCLRIFEDTGSVYAVAVTPQGDRIISSEYYEGLRLWDVNKGCCLRTFEGGRSSLALTTDGQYAVSWSVNHTLRLWPLERVGKKVADWQLSRPRRTFHAMQAATVVQRSIKSARRALARGQPNEAGMAIKQARSQPGYERDSTLLKIWRQVGCLAGQRKGLRATYPFKGSFPGSNVIIITPDGRFALSENKNKTMRLRELPSGRNLCTFKKQKKWRYTAALAPNKRFIVSHTDEGVLQLWDLESGECLHTLEGHKKYVTAVTLTPDESFAISCSRDRTLRLWDLKSGECLRIFEGHEAEICGVVLTPDGSCAISGSWDRTLRLWDLVTGECLRIFDGHEEKVNTLTITLDGCYVVSGSNDETLRLWDANSGKCLRIFKGHKKSVITVAISSDGRYIVSCDDDRELRLWDVESGKCLHVLQEGKSDAHLHMLRDSAKKVIFTFDCRCVISKVEPGRVWELDWDYEFPEPVEWNEGARPYLETFLTLHIPYAGPQNLVRKGQSAWTEADFQDLLAQLGHCGYGWLFSEGVRRKLEMIRPEVEDAWIERNAQLTQAGIVVQGQIEIARKALACDRPVEAVAALRRSMSQPGYERNPELLGLWRQAGLQGGRRIGLLITHLPRIFRVDKAKMSAVSITPDDQYAVSGRGKYSEGDRDRTLLLWDLESGKCLRTLVKNHRVPITPDGCYILPGDENKTLRLLELSDGCCLRTIETCKPSIRANASVNAITPDGRFAVLNNGKSIMKWDLESGKCMNILVGHNHSINGLVLTPDGRFVVSVDNHAFLRLWDIETGECIRTIEGQTGLNQEPRFAAAPDGRGVITIDDCVLRLWDLEKSKCLRVFEGHKKQVDTVAVTPDGRFALSSSWSGELRFWHLGTGECVQVFEDVDASSIYDITFSPDGRYAIYTAKNRWDFTLRVWELDWDYEFPEPVDWDEGARPYLETFLILHTPSDPDDFHRNEEPSWTEKEFRDLLTQLRYRGYGWLKPEGVRRKLDEIKKALIEQNTRAAGVVQEEREAAKTALECNRPAEAGAAIRRARSQPGYRRDNELLNLWNRAGFKGGRRTGLQGSYYLRTFEGHTDWVNSVTFTPDGKFALSGGTDHTLRLWDISSGRCLHTFTGHTEEVNTIIAVPDGAYAVSSSSDKTLKLWQLKNGRCLRTFKGHEGEVVTVAITPDGGFIVSGGDDNTVRLWNLTNGECLRILKGHKNQVNTVALTPDGRYALSGGGKWKYDDRKDHEHDYALRLWDLSNGHCLRTFEGHTDTVNSVSISTNGRLAVSGGKDGRLRLWDLASGDCLNTSEWEIEDIDVVNISPDGRFVICARGATLQLWCLNTCEYLFTLADHEADVSAVAFSPDGCSVLSGSRDNTLRLWELDWEYEFPESSDWDEGARPYLELFLTLHTPYGPDGISRLGAPAWTEDDFQDLVNQLAYRAYAWLRPDGIRQELEKMIRKWQGPPLL